MARNTDSSPEDYVAPPPPIDPTPHDPPDPGDRAQELRVIEHSRPLTDDEKAELDKLALAEAEAAGHVVEPPPEVVIPEDHPVRLAVAVNAILGMLETLPAFAAMAARVRAALNYVPPKE